MHIVPSDGYLILFVKKLKFPLGLKRRKTFFLLAANFRTTGTHSFRDTRTRIPLPIFELFIIAIVHHDTFEATFSTPGSEVYFYDEDKNVKNFNMIIIKNIKKSNSKILIK